MTTIGSAAASVLNRCFEEVFCAAIVCTGGVVCSNARFQIRKKARRTILSRFWVPFFDISDQLFEPVEFEFIDQLQLLAELAFREAFIAVPDDIIFGDVNQMPAFILAIWHFGMGEFDELLLVWGQNIGGGKWEAS